MRVLVTGATGFLGHAVVSALADHGHTVVSLARHGHDVPDKVERHVTADIREAADVLDTVATVDAVCHLAALARVRESIEQPVEYWGINVGGTLNVLSALSQTSTSSTPKRLVLASTGAVYGAPELQPIGESAPTAPGNPYAASKLAADLAAAGLAGTGRVGAISLRAFNIVGASGGRGDHDTSRIIPKALAVQAGRADELVINGDGSAIRDFVHVDDMADAFVRAVDASTPGEWRAYNIGSGRRTSVRDVVDTVEQITGRAVPMRHRPPAPEPPELLADASRAHAELGWQASRSDLPRIVRDAWYALTSGYSARA